MEITTTQKATQTDVKKNPNVIDDQKALSRIGYKEEKKKKNRTPSKANKKKNRNERHSN